MRSSNKKNDISEAAVAGKTNASRKRKVVKKMAVSKKRPLPRKSSGKLLSRGCKKIGEVMAQVAQIETPINAAQKVIGWDVIFKVERVKQPFLPTR